MKLKTLAAITLSVGLAALTGCGDKPKTQPSASTPKPAPGDKHDDHDHGEGPHKGTIGEMGGKHLEFVVDHGTKEATIYLLAGDAKTPFHVKADKATLTIKDPAFKVELKPVPDKGDPAGKSSRFVGKDDRFGKHQEFAGEFDVIDDSVDPKKPHHGEFEEKDEKEKKK